MLELTIILRSEINIIDKKIKISEFSIPNIEEILCNNNLELL